MADDLGRRTSGLSGIETQITTRLVMNNKEKMIPAMAAARGVLMRRGSKAGS